MSTPSQKEIEHEENEAGSDIADGINRFRGMTYAEGVSAALRWIMGEEERPYTQE